MAMPVGDISASSGISSIPAIFKGWVKAFQHYAEAPAGPISSTELVLAAPALIAAVLLRLAGIMQPVSHDEAYTAVAFSSGSLWNTVTDYSLPNNHVLHSVLVNLSMDLFGKQPWAIRLPAFLAGVLLIPAVYWLARELYGKDAALLSAALAAYFPVLIAYGDSARGYSMVMLFTVLLAVLAERARRTRSWAVWGSIAVAAALGLFTIPTMLLPAGSVFVWLLLCAIVGDFGASYRSRIDYLLHWLLVGLGTALLTALLYTPIIRVSGLNRLLTNQFVAPVAWKAFPHVIRLRLAETWSQWIDTVPALLVALLVIGFVLSLVFQHRLTAHRIPMPLAFGMWMAVVLIVERPNAYDRTWSFLAPLFLVWASAGLLLAVRGLDAVAAHGRFHIPFVLSAVVCLMVFVEGLGLIPTLPSRWSAQGTVERTALFLRDRLTDRDVVLVAFPVNAPLWYYFERYDLAQQYFDDDRVFDRAFIVVNVNFQQSIATVLAANKLEPALLDLAHARLMQEYGGVQIYEGLRASP